MLMLLLFSFEEELIEESLEDSLNLSILLLEEAEASFSLISELLESTREVAAFELFIFNLSGLEVVDLVRMMVDS